MKRILICWEHGTGLGHIMRLIPFARALKKEGHHIAFAVHELANAQTLFDKEGYQWFQAPVNNRAFDERVHSIQFYNYCRMIMCHNYHVFDVVYERVTKWIDIYKQYKPDIVIFEFSPGAYIASLALDVKRIMIGTGFTIPPLEYPIPCYRHMPNNMTFEQRKAVEDQLTENINNVLKKINVNQITHLYEICSADLRLLMTYEELDYYDRHNTEYFGVTSVHQGLTPEWPKSDKEKRIFVYLHSEYTPPQVMKALKKTGYSICAYIKNPKRLLLKYMSENIRLLEKSVDMGKVSKDADIIVCHGGHGTVGKMLVEGLPMIIIPIKYNIEAFIINKNVENSGIGIVVENSKDTNEILYKIENILYSQRYKEKSMFIANKYKQWDDDCAVKKIIEFI